MLEEFKELQNLYESIKDLERVINSMELEPTITDVLNVALAVVQKYNELQLEEFKKLRNK